MSKTFGIKLLLIILGALTGAVSNALLEVKVAEETINDFNNRN